MSTIAAAPMKPLASYSLAPVAALQSYEARRLQPTARIVETNREHGPEIVMQLAEERAPDGFTDVASVFAPNELEEIARRYKAIAGFDREQLNALDAAGASPAPA